MNGFFGNTQLIISLSLVLFTCSACGDPQDSSPGPSATTNPVLNPSTDTVPIEVDMTTGSPPPAADGAMTPQEQIANAQEDLANRLGLDATEVNVITSGPVTWRSGALGCPKPGMNYTQALVPGFRIILQAGQDTYHYHAKSGGQPFHCPQNRIEPPSSGSSYQ